MTITLDGSSLTIEKVVAIARNNEKVELAPEALERIKVCRAMLEEKLANKEVMYGTNTGIGEFSETMLNDEQVKESGYEPLKAAIEKALNPGAATETPTTPAPTEGAPASAPGQ